MSKSTLETRVSSRAAMIEMFEKLLMAHEAVCTSKESISSIPELLVKTRGNMSEAARILNVNRQSVAPLARDYECVNHIIVNGVLMIAHGNQRAQREKHYAAR